MAAAAFKTQPAALAGPAKAARRPALPVVPVRGPGARCRSYAPSVQPAAPMKADNEHKSLLESVTASLLSLFDDRSRLQSDASSDELPAEIKELLAQMSEEEGHHGGVARHSHIAEMLATESGASSFEV